MKRLKRLTLPHLRLFLALAVELLTLLEALQQVGWLRPWLLPGRRVLDVSKVRYIGDRRRPLRPFGLVLWGLAGLIVAHLTWVADPRPWLVLAIEYGAVVAFYILLRTVGMLKKSLV
jgi:hypothetical protein